MKIRLMPAFLCGRAAEWHAVHLMPAEAVHYRQDAGDDAATVRLMATYALQLFAEGRTGTLSGWWDWAEARDALGLEPELAMSGAISLATSGDAERAERYAEALYAAAPESPSGQDGPGTDAWQALVRSFFCERGPTQSVADGELACELISRDDSWRRAAVVGPRLGPGRPGR